MNESALPLGRLRHLGIILAVGLLAGIATAQSVPQSAPIPDAAAVREANAKIKSLFASDIAKIKSSNDRLALSTKLFLASQDPQVELPRKYALLNLSLTYAYPTNYAIIPMPIVDELYSSFRIPDSKAKTDVLAKAAKSRDNQILEEAIDLGLKWIDQAIADDRYDLARQFADSAAAMANASKDLDRIKAVNARLATIANLKTAYAPLQKDAHLVASNDPDALARAGSFCCFTKNQWDKGLAFLAASSDPALKTPAKMEIAHPAAPIDQVRLADAWWDASAKQPAAIQRSIQLHACSWYKLALPDLVGLVKFRVTHRLKDAPAGPVEPRFKELLLDLGDDVTMKFLLLPAGTFKMGSPPKTINLQTYGGERQITLTKPFYMSVFPVTQRQYKQIIGKNLSHTKSPDNPVDMFRGPRPSPSATPCPGKRARRSSSPPKPSGNTPAAPARPPSTITAGTGAATSPSTAGQRHPLVPSAPDRPTPGDSTTCPATSPSGAATTTAWTSTAPRTPPTPRAPTTGPAVAPCASPAVRPTPTSPPSPAAPPEKNSTTPLSASA